MAKTVILGSARTPIGKMGGGLSTLEATELGAIAIGAALERAAVDPEQVEHVVMGQEAAFASAVSTIPGVVEAKGYTNLHALPRIAWDGRQDSLRMMRVMLSGIMFPPVRPTRDNWV